MGSGTCFTHLPSIRFTVAPSADLAVFFHFDTNHLRMATDRTIFDKELRLARGTIDRNDDLLAADIANVRGFGGHARTLSTATLHEWASRSI